MVFVFLHFLFGLRVVQIANNNIELLASTQYITEAWFIPRRESKEINKQLKISKFIWSFNMAEATLVHLNAFQ